MELPNSSKFKLSDHFVERWNERNPDDWNRFVWILENTFYHLLCTDHLGRSHCLHYNPNSKEWFVFITDKRNKLITILPTEYYIRMGNSVNLESFSLKLEELWKLLGEATHGELPVFVIDYRDPGTSKLRDRYAVLPFADAQELIELRREKNGATKHR